MTVVNKPLLGCLICSVIFFSWSSPLSAQETNQQKLAITDVSQADQDFHVQGEYLGDLGFRRRFRRRHEHRD